MTDINKAHEEAQKENEKREEEKKIKREFLLNKDISAVSVEPVIKGILEINAYDAEQEEKDSSYVRKPIKLIIDSYGGSIYCGNALISVIDSSETPIHGYCYGKAMSMGFMIFSACHYRYAHPLATLMYHDGGTTMRGMTEEIQLDIDQLRRLIKHGDRFLLANTGLTESKLEEVKRLRINWYMFAEEAMQYGIVDEIIQSKRNRKK
jgi:ATP-dependent Clp protease protease subunit